MMFLRLKASASVTFALTCSHSQRSDQSDYDIRMWSHGWAASKQSLQVPPLRLPRLFLSPRLGSARFARCSQALTESLFPSRLTKAWGLKR